MEVAEAIELLRNGEGGVRQWNDRRESGIWLPAPLDGMPLQNAQLRGANLSRIGLVNANLSEANLREANLFHADLRGAYLTSADLRKANLCQADLRGADLRKARLAEAELVNAILGDADLRETDLTDADLRGAHLTNAKLRGANLRNARLIGADLRGAELVEANLIGVVLSDAQLRGADLRAVDAHHGNFMDADCRDTDLRGAKLCAADLRGAVFRGASLDGADLQFVNMRGTDFVDARFGPCTLRYSSCFLSYCAVDHEFATKLHGDLVRAGVRCWRWDVDIQAGAPLWEVIAGAIETYDKVLLVASSSSLQSEGVCREIQWAVFTETQRKTKVGSYLSADVLVPIQLDDFLLSGWTHPLKNDVVRRRIANAENWKADGEYSTFLQQLLHDLESRASDVQSA